MARVELLERFVHELKVAAYALVERAGHEGFAVEHDAVEDEVAEALCAVGEGVVDEFAVEDGVGVEAVEGGIVGFGEVEAWCVVGMLDGDARQSI